MKVVAIVLILFFLNCTLYGGTYIVVNTLNSGVGSFRQAIINVNASTDVTNSIVFNIPTSNGGYNSTTGVFTITISATLPELKKSDVLIDGYSQTSSTGNTNIATFRSKTTVGTGLDGIEGTADDPVFPAIAGCEIQIISTIATYPNRKLVVVGQRNIIRGIAFRNVRVLLKGNNNGLLEGCTFGINAHSFTDPGSNYITSLTGSDEGSLALYDSTVNLTIKNNLFGYANQRGILVIDANWNYNLQIIENEIAFSNRRNDFFGGGIEIAPILTLGTADSTSAIFKIRNTTIARNVIHDAKATAAGKREFGIEVNLKESSFNLTTTFGKLDSLLIENNTLYENNVAVLFTKMGSSSVGNFMRYNIINNNIANGISLDNRYAVASINYVTSPLKCAISKNSFYNNGDLGINIRDGDITTPAASAGQVNANDNGDTDDGTNGLLNFPLITRCDYVNPDSLEIEGICVTGAIVEIYAADNNTSFSPLYATSPNVIPSGYTMPYGTSGYGEGKLFIDSLIEGSSKDLDTTQFDYYDDGTGVLGLRRENKWRIVIPRTSFPSGFDLLWRLTSTATDANGNTSEFGPSPVVFLLPVYKQEFNAVLQNNNVKLNFDNQTTVALKKVTFQWSADGITWKDLIELNAFTNTQNYSYLHTNPIIGNNYYRVKTLATNDNISYSLSKLRRCGQK